jgi:hypothetical protein
MDCTDFYFKVEDDNQEVVGDFRVADEGIYYYRKGSRILSPDENDKSRDSDNGFISMEDLVHLFETFIEAGVVVDTVGQQLEICRQRRSVVITRVREM